ncbi:MAG: putative signal transducing protein [Candidatus Cryptobacteroides sp.]
MEQEFKTVAQFSDAMSAEITVGMLRANGIEAHIFGQASSYPSINVAINGIEVKVNAEDYDAAMNLIKQNEE